MHHPDRRGKTAALNRAVERADGEIIVFSDANNDFSPNALRELVKHFSDPAVGGVCGVKRIKPASDRQASVGDGLYWKYESAIKLAEGRVRTITNADGEIFAMRRALYHSVDERIINDDAQITIDIVQKGFRVLYEPAAESREYASISVRDDFFVKVRMVAGGFQTVVENWRVLFPPLTWFAFTFLSHKVLRWLIPELLIVLFVATIALSANPLYQGLLFAQFAFYATAFYGWGRAKKGRELPTLIYVPFYFCAMNLAALFGLYRYASGWKTQHWRKAQR
jgi:cellulose synthase/poly-beta-1,6-N-acetylglucosamine synthase-like glycosyltransferase